VQEKALPKTLRVFELIDDPRRVHATTLHNLTDIIAITIMATLCGATNWVEIELWAKSKQKWLETVLPLPHGIPSHDTVSRVFALLDPGQMVDAFTAWTSELAQHIKGVVALDGKTVRRSMSTADGRGPSHVVSAFAAGSGLVLTQMKVDEKSNEIVVLPQLIRMLDLQDCVVTVDAMGCQVEVAKAVREQKGHYMLHIKDNQPTLHADAKRLFEWALDPARTSLLCEQRLCIDSRARCPKQPRHPRTLGHREQGALDSRRGHGRGQEFAGRRQGSTETRRLGPRLPTGAARPWLMRLPCARR